MCRTEATTCCHQSHGGWWRRWSPEILRNITKPKKRSKERKTYWYGLRPTCCGCPWPLSDVLSPETREPGCEGCSQLRQKNPAGKGPEKEEKKSCDAPITRCCAGRRRESSWRVKHRRTSPETGGGTRLQVAVILYLAAGGRRTQGEGC